MIEKQTRKNYVTHHKKKVLSRHNQLIIHKTSLIVGQVVRVYLCGTAHGIVRALEQYHYYSRIKKKAHHNTHARTGFNICRRLANGPPRDSHTIYRTVL